MDGRALLRKMLLIGVGGRWGVRLMPAIAVICIVELRAPAALAFPYSQAIGNTVIYSERPIGSGMTPILARADRLLRTSPIDVPGIGRQIVLTDGGWRWRALALYQNDAIALRRPFSNVLILNRSDIAADRVTNGASIGGVRTMSGTIAHETVHLLVARRLGELRATRLPTWKQEGYADYVAGETSLDRRDEARIRAADPDAAVLAYYDGRRRVAARLAENGGSVDALLAP